MKLARTLRLDVSDDNVFDLPAPSGEWAISGGFEFSNWTPTGPQLDLDWTPTGTQPDPNQNQTKPQLDSNLIPTGL